MFVATLCGENGITDPSTVRTLQARTHAVMPLKRAAAPAAPLPVAACGVVRETRAEFLKRLRRTVLVRLAASPAVARKAVLVYALGLEDCNAFKP